MCIAFKYRVDWYSTIETVLEYFSYFFLYYFESGDNNTGYIKISRYMQRIVTINVVKCYRLATLYGQKQNGNEAMST